MINWNHWQRILQATVHYFAKRDAKRNLYIQIIDSYVLNITIIIKIQYFYIVSSAIINTIDIPFCKPLYIKEFVIDRNFFI